MNTRKYLVGLCLLAALAATPIFAANPFEYEAAKVGQVNLNLGVSIGWGIGADVGADFILGKFDIKHFPMEWGIGVRGLAEFGFWGGFDWGAAGLWTLHKGFSFAKNADFDVYVGVGAGVFQDVSGMAAATAQRRSPSASPSGRSTTRHRLAWAWTRW